MLTGAASTATRTTSTCPWFPSPWLGPNTMNLPKTMNLCRRNCYVRPWDTCVTPMAAILCLQASKNNVHSCFLRESWPNMPHLQLKMYRGLLKGFTTQSPLQGTVWQRLADLFAPFEIHNEGIELQNTFCFIKKWRKCVYFQLFVDHFLHSDAAAGRVRGRNQCNHFSDSARFLAVGWQWAALISAVNFTCRDLGRWRCSHWF